MDVPRTRRRPEQGDPRGREPDPVGRGRRRAHRAAHRRRGGLLHDGPLQPLRRQGRRRRRALRGGLPPALRRHERDAEDRRPGRRPPLVRARAYRQTALTQRDALHGDVRRRGARLRADASRAALVAHGAFERLDASVQRCIDAGAFKGDAAEIAEVWWGSMHGLVMLELVGIDPVKGDPSRALRPLCSTRCSTACASKACVRDPRAGAATAAVNAAAHRVRLSSPIAARRMVDSALDRVFDEPYEIRQRGRLRARDDRAHGRRCRSRARARSPDSWSARSPLAKLSTKAGKKIPMPAIKYTLAAIPIAMQLGNSVRHGVREVQVLASYLIHRLREAGVEPRRGLVDRPRVVDLARSRAPARPRPHARARRRRPRAPLDHALGAHGVGQVGRPSRPVGGRRRRSPRPPSGVEGVGSRRRRR